MVCRSNAPLADDQADVTWSTWAGRTFTASRYVTPASLPELVEIVAQATETGHEIHAVGSAWVFEDVAAADWVVDLRTLKAAITDVVDEALTDPWRPSGRSGERHPLGSRPSRRAGYRHH